MDKLVEITLSGLQVATGEEDSAPVETCHQAEYHKMNDSHYLIYEEELEGFDQKVQNRIKIKGAQVEVLKKGPVDVHMIFEEKKEYMTSYKTPFGEILLGIETECVEVLEGEDTLFVKVLYTLNANGEHLANCTLEMKAKSRGC